MGFKHWTQAFLIISMFIITVGVPCFFVGKWGAEMINDLGNHPSQAAQIQTSTGWKILVVEILAFVSLCGVFIFLYNLQNG
jgi:hypothetical protein